MRDALQRCVQSDEYKRFEFQDDDVFAACISGREVWSLAARITKTAGPVLLLLRLADTNLPTLSKLKGTCDYIKSVMNTDEEDTLEAKICTAFNHRASELDCDIANAAYVLDPQFVSKSKSADHTVMSSFWRVARAVLRVADDVQWRRLRTQLVDELASYRMKTGGFVLESYDTPNTCNFWGVAGCHAPNLRRLAFCLTTLPCSSGEAERNWQEVKLNMTKKRNRLDRAKLEKIIFVRRFNNLKMKLFDDNIRQQDGFREWVRDLLKQAAEEDSSDKDEDTESQDSDDIVFHDLIEIGEQRKINGREPGEAVVPLTQLKKDNAAKSWLFEKYYKMCFLDKNPEAETAADEPLSDEEDWEHRVITNVVWWRHRGYAVETALYGSPESQSIEKYQINSHLHEMIRDSPHNVRSMASQIDDDDVNVGVDSE